MVNWIARSASVKEQPGDSEDEVYVDSGIEGSEFMVDDFVDKVFVSQDGISHRCNAIPSMPVSYPTRQGIETLWTRKFIQQAFVTHMLQKKHTRCKAAQASHDSLIYPNDTSATLSPISLSETTKSPSKPRFRFLMGGGPTYHCAKRISAGGWGAFPTGFILGGAGSIFSYINNPDGTGSTEKPRNTYVCRKITSFVLGGSRWTFLCGKGKRRRLGWEQYSFSVVLGGRVWLHKTW